MLHKIPTEKFGPFGEPMTAAIQACVHCGFCLAACPTYSVLGQEMDTPRGRIVLMKKVLEGALAPEAAQPHIERCLGCLACEPACPSGVSYRELINPFRAIGQSRAVGSRSKLRAVIESDILPYPDRFRLAVSLGRFVRPLSPWLPRAVRPMFDLLPGRLPNHFRIPQLTPARGQRRARVALLAGCVQQALDPDINAAAIEVLSRNGVEVVVPSSQGCCGGLAWHTGNLTVARSFALRNLAAFPKDVDAVITTAAGCGSTMQEYGLILKGIDKESNAKDFSRRVLDVSVFLARLGLREQPGKVLVQKAAYQDACHLLHAQRVQSEPRLLLRTIPGLELKELPDAHLCCGSAGTYNLDQPEIAAALGERKARAVMGCGADMVISGNIGCMMQLRAHLLKLGSTIAVRHTIQLLRDAYAGSPLSESL